MESNFTKNTDPLYKDIGGPVNTKYSSDFNEHDRESWKVSLQNLYTDVSTLIEKEGALIRSEIGDKSTLIKAAAGSMAVGGVMLFVGLLCAAATAVILLGYVMPLWASALLVTAAFLLIGGVLLATGKKKLDPNKLKLNSSMEAFSEIRHSLKEKVNEITKH